MKKMVEIFSCKRHGTSLIFGESRLIAAVDSPVPDFRIGSAEKPEQKDEPKKETAASEASAKKDAAAAVERAQGPLDKVALAAVKEKALAFVPVVSTDSNNPAANLDLRALVSSARDMADIGNILKEYPDIFPAAKFPELTPEIETPATTTAPPAAAAETAPATIPETATAPIEAPEKTKAEMLTEAFTKLNGRTPQGVNPNEADKTFVVKDAAVTLNDRVRTGVRIRTLDGQTAITARKDALPAKLKIAESKIYKIGGVDFIKVTYEDGDATKEGFMARQYLTLTAPAKIEVPAVVEAMALALTKPEKDTPSQPTVKLAEFNAEANMPLRVRRPEEPKPDDYPKVAPDEYAAKEGEVVVMYKTVGAETDEFKKGNPVKIIQIVPETGVARVQSPSGAVRDVTIKDHLDGANPSDAKAFAKGEYQSAMRKYEAASEGLKRPGERAVQFINAVTDRSGKQIVAGTKAIVSTAENGDIKVAVTSKDSAASIYTFDKVEFAKIAPIAVTDVEFEKPDRLYATLKSGTRIFRRGPTGVEQDVVKRTGTGQPVAVLGKATENGTAYLSVRTADGQEGFVPANAIDGDVLVKRLLAQTPTEAIAAYKNPTAPTEAPSAVTASPTAAPAAAPTALGITAGIPNLTLTPLGTTTAKKAAVASIGAEERKLRPAAT